MAAFDDEPPEELRGWNWGAFWLNWVWGIGNQTWIALLMFVPGVNLVMPFVLGWKGNAWAWRNGNWKDVAQFQRTQRIWARVGWGAAIGVPALAGMVLWGVTAMMTSSTPYQIALKTVHDHPALAADFGHPVVRDGWFVSGGINIENNLGQAERGRANLSFDVVGPKGRGTVDLLATKDGPKWTILHLTVTGENGQVHDLMPARSPRPSRQGQ